jgi:hypothetical protein
MKYTNDDKLAVLIAELEAISNVHIKETLTFETALRLLAEREIDLTKCKQEYIDRLASMLKG